MKNLGASRSFSGIELSWHKRTVYVRHNVLVKRFLEENKVHASKLTSTAMNANPKARKENDHMWMKTMR